MNQEHERRIVEQFTRQARAFRAFAETPGAPREVCLAAADVAAKDTVLDVACGPGVTTCDLAQLASHATGIDATPMPTTISISTTKATSKGYSRPSVSTYSGVVHVRG